MEIDAQFYREFYEDELLDEFKETEPKVYLEILQEMLSSNNTNIEELENELFYKDLYLKDNEYFNEAFDDFIRYESKIARDIEKDYESYKSDTYSYYGVSRNDF